VFAGEVLGRDQLELWARGLGLFTAARASCDPARFCDVDYEAFVADPMGTMERVYAWLGRALTGAAADAMRALASGPPGGAADPGGAGGAGGAGGGRPVHRYALADFGLTGEQVDERFAGYQGAGAHA
jgi:hypothetical protein